MYGLFTIQIYGLESRYDIWNSLKGSTLAVPTPWIFKSGGSVYTVFRFSFLNPSPRLSVTVLEWLRLLRSINLHYASSVLDSGTVFEIS